MLRATDPIVATYARADAVDVRISSRAVPADGTTAAELVDATAARIAELFAGHVWAEGATGWPEAIADALGPGGSLAVVEVGTGGSLAALLGDRDWLTFAECLGPRTATARDHATPARSSTWPDAAASSARAAAGSPSGPGRAAPTPPSRSSWSVRTGPIASGGSCSSAAPTDEAERPSPRST